MQQDSAIGIGGIMEGGGTGEAIVVSSQPPPMIHQQVPQQPEMQQSQPPQQQHYHQHHSCPPDCTIWMGDLNPDWSDQFIREAFGVHSQNISNVKLVTTDHGQKKATYCFVEFRDEDSARNAILDVNGKTFANSSHGRFNLAFANSPNNMQVEYNLFVNNLSPEVDDVALFQHFGKLYRSCRGAKVYRDEDGRSKEQGFVRFISETDQQKALIDMNKQLFYGRELFLKLARPKTRTTGRYAHGYGRGGGFRYDAPLMGGGGGMGGSGGYQSHMAQLQNAAMPMVAAVGMPNVQYLMMPGVAGAAPYQVALSATPYGTQLATNHGMAGFGQGSMLPTQQFNGQPVIFGASNFQQGAYLNSQIPQAHIIQQGPTMMAPMANANAAQFMGHSMGSAAPQFNQPLPQPKAPPEPVYEDVEPYSVNEHNAMTMNNAADLQTAIDASRWGPIAFPADTRTKQLQHLLQAPGNL